MSVLDSTMSMFDSRVAKKGQSRNIDFSSDRRPLRSRLLPASSQAEIALPKPYQPGSSSRHWPQEKPQGMARRSSMRRLALREAGREPMLSSAISAIGVAEKK